MVDDRKGFYPGWANQLKIADGSIPKFLLGEVKVKGEFKAFFAIIKANAKRDKEFGERPPEPPTPSPEKVNDMHERMSWQKKVDIIHQEVVKKWPPYGEEDIRFLALALAGEVGELCNLFKKEWRGDINQENFGEWRKNVLGELADVQIYLELLSRAMGVDLDGACHGKIVELLRRWPSAIPKIEELERKCVETKAEGNRMPETICPKCFAHGNRVVMVGVKLPKPNRNPNGDRFPGSFEVIPAVYHCHTEWTCPACRHVQAE